MNYFPYPSAVNERNKKWGNMQRAPFLMWRRTTGSLSKQKWIWTMHKFVVHSWSTLNINFKEEKGSLVMAGISSIPTGSINKAVLLMVKWNLQFKVVTNKVKTSINQWRRTSQYIMGMETSEDTVNWSSMKLFLQVFRTVL